MPTGPVGSQTLPVPAGPNLSHLVDPSLDGLLAYAAHWLNVSLNPKLANLGSAKPSCAVPDCNRFPVNPLETWVRSSKPALYAWEHRAKHVPWSLVFDALEREIHMLYVFDEFVVPCGNLPWAGLPDAISRVFEKAAARRMHPTFAYPGATVGQAIGITMNWVNWGFVGGESRLLQALPGSGGRTSAASSETQEQRVYQAYLATWTLTERVDPDTDAVADNEHGHFIIEAGGGEGDPAEPTVEYLERDVINS